MATQRTSSAPPVCHCGLYAVGECVDCQSPLCKDHGELQDGRFRCPKHAKIAQASARKAKAASEAAAELKKAKNREKQARYRARHKPQPCAACDQAGDFAYMDPDELADQDAEMKDFGIFRYKVPGSAKEHTDWLCKPHRDPEQSWHSCDACDAPLYFSGEGTSHSRISRDREEASYHGYTDVLDRPPFHFEVELCPRCDEKLEHAHSGSCSGCDLCRWSGNYPLRHYDSDA